RSVHRDERELARRAGGGRAAVAGEGTVGVILALPSVGALLPAPVGADRLLNRYVRGLLAGRTSLGAGTGAHYFGRDFVSAEGRPLALVSQDGTRRGAAILEALVGISRPVPLPPSESGYPEHGDPRAHGP